MSKTVNKSAKTGKFVSTDYAASNPDTTYSQPVFDIDAALGAISKRFAEEYKEDFDKTQKSFTPSDQRILRAQAQEADIAAQIVMLAQEPDSEAKQHRLYQALDRLSELIAEQGEYTRAANVTPNGERKEHFNRIAEAIGIDDKNWCQCSDETVNGVSRSREQMLGEVYHANRTKTLYRCRACGFMNVK